MDYERNIQIGFGKLDQQPEVKIENLRNEDQFFFPLASITLKLS